MPPKSKAKNAANQHDKRHESGLAAPAKKVTKKQSHGQLNGQLDGKPGPSVQPPALPSSSGVNPDSTAPPILEPIGIASPQKTVPDHAALSDCVERDRTYSDASVEDGARYGEMPDVHDVPISPTTEAPLPTFRQVIPTHAGSTFSSISTILSYYPLRDAISILILLLSLPPTLVLVIQTLFASLTFVPPTTSISLSTLPNIKEMFNSPNLGYPALATILIVDLIFWVCWLPVWKPLQGVFLDLSQAVIAVSLSGATASTGGPTYSIATTTIIVAIVHVLRYKAIHLTTLDYFRSVIHKMDIGIQVDVPAFATNYVSFSPIDRGWFYTVIRTILGIHIVSQGVTTCIRRSLVKANEQNASVPAIMRSDTESAAGVDFNSRAGITFSEGNQHGPVGASTDGRAPGPSAARTDNRPRESTTKKKRKQANQVRSQQPLWAAIASTKVTFVKEMEQRDALEDSRETTRVHNKKPNIITNTADDPTTHFCVRKVRSTDILFSAQLATNFAVESSQRLEEGSNVVAGIDKSKPFYVTINGAAWSSTRIVSGPPQESSSGTKCEQYDGEIFGLAPLSSYVCEIIDITSQEVLCSISVITQPAPTPDQAVSTVAPPQHQALRPASPITTLKQSIQVAEAKLNETRNRGKRSKKDQRAGHTDTKREITMLKSKLESSGGADDKQERRLLQINQHKAQADEAAAEVKTRINTIGEVPSDELAESEAKRSIWQAATNAKRKATRDLDGSKADADRDASAIRSESQQTDSKKEKVASRHLQRSQELEKLCATQQEVMTAKQKRDYDRTQNLATREKEHSDMFAAISAYEHELQALQVKAQSNYEQINALHNYSAQGQPPPYPGPPTPENLMSGLTNGSFSSPQSNGFYTNGQTSYHQSPFHSAQASLSNTQAGAPRVRSSSMLSQYSGFTDPGEEYSFAVDQPRAQLTWPMTSSASAGAVMQVDRQGSEGSGSASQTNGSTGSNSPRPDARIFVPGKNGASVGTIGQPRKVPQSPANASHGSGR